ncbi:UNVERIFIED_CONTAM: Tricyclene synthase 0e23, chloroplastic [Sesamum radiatum]|uniref:Tricyclene synthase 0e23, chloroplastic n=1 Tax=Sesamum radiatum TaxID=300843 RepID=A0AAW2JSH0_SESRA
MEEVGQLLLQSKEEENENPMESLVFVDAIQRVGVDHHFEEEIEMILGQQYNRCAKSVCFHGLHDVSLFFRLLRQQGYCVSADVFNNFKGKDGKLLEEVKEDIRGLMALYEAAQLSFHGETIMDEAQDFSRLHLSAYLHQNCDNLCCDAEAITNTLTHPQHKTIPRLTAKDFLHGDLLKGSKKWQKSLRELANMDFLIEKSTHQDELLQISKWDHSAIDMLPNYMRMSYKALLHTTNQIANNIQNMHGHNPIEYMKATWGSLCNAFLVEAKWFASAAGDELPTAKEYLENGKVSSGVHVVLVHLFFLLGLGGLTCSAEGDDSTDHREIHLNHTSKLTSSLATILRLWDDLGCSKDELQDGQDGSYIDYYMKDEPKLSVKQARQHVLDMITNEWKNVNEECFRLRHYSSATCFKRASLNLARMVALTYGYDEHQRLPLLEKYVKTTLFN